MEWIHSDKAFQLEWGNPTRSNSEITGYYVIVQYPSPKKARNPSDPSIPTFRKQEVYLPRFADKNYLKLEKVCGTIFDVVNVTIAAYAGDGGTILPGKPRDYVFNCNELIIEGLQIGILSAVGILAGNFFIIGKTQK